MDTRQEKLDNENYAKNFTRVPNIIFASYKKLTKEEKFLYCTLRQVYWDMKPRFVSLRELSELTDYSIGALSKMLPRLNDCGLIHAEKKREKTQSGKEKGNAKYHITIPDIWELNRQFFDCSPNEQTEDPSDKVAQSCSPNKQVRSPNEQACSPNVTSLFTKSDKVVPFGEQDQAQVERAKDKKDITKDRMNGESPKENHSPTLSFSPEEETIYQLASQLKLSYLKRNEKTRKHCAKLAKEGIITLEKMASLMQFCRQRDYLKGKDLNLGNMAGEADSWLQMQRPLDVPAPTPQNRPKSLAEKNAEKMRFAGIKAQ
jgi:hypothetical protein